MSPATIGQELAAATLRMQKSGMEETGKAALSLIESAAQSAPTPQASAPAPTHPSKGHNIDVSA